MRADWLTYSDASGSSNMTLGSLNVTPYNPGVGPGLRDRHLRQRWSAARGGAPIAIPRAPCSAFAPPHSQRSAARLARYVRLRRTKGPTP